MQALEHRRLRIGPVDLAINLDGFNPVTQVLAIGLGRSSLPEEL